MNSSDVEVSKFVRGWGLVGDVWRLDGLVENCMSQRNALELPKKSWHLGLYVFVVRDVPKYGTVVIGDLNWGSDRGLNW